MKALFIGSDPSLFDQSSNAYARMQTYADAIGTLHIVMRSSAAPSVSTQGNLTIHNIQAGKMSVHKLADYAHELIVREGVEVVSAQDPFEHGWAAVRAVKGTGAKLHIQVHTDFLSPWFIRGGIFRSPQVSMPAKNLVRRALADYVLRKADGIRVVSERVKQSILSRYGSRIPEPTVIPIAIEGTLPEAVPLPPHSFPFALVTVGRLEPEKRIDDLLTALASIADRYPAVGLVIIGEGRERARLMTLVLEKNLTGRVIFAGARADAWGMMRSAQAYIQASAYEGYGRTLVEAALARIPIITTDVGVVGELFTGYEDVLATPPGDPVNLAFHVIALLEDVAAREVMIRSAETKAQAHVAQFVDLPNLIARDLSRLIVTPA